MNTNHADIAEALAEVREELGESIVLATSGGRRTVTALFVEQQEQQTVKRADIHLKSDVNLTIGDTFSQQGRTWRLMYRDTTHHGMSHWFCHEQLPDLAIIKDRNFRKSERGVDVFTLTDTDPLRVKIHRQEGEVVQDRRRRMQSEFWIYFESNVRPTTDQVIVDKDGNSYQVQSYQSPQRGEELPFVIAVAADG